MLQLHETTDEAMAERAGVSLDAVQLARASELVDLHLETYIPPRLWGYSLAKRHDKHWLRGRFFGHLDLPRALDGGLTGGMWSIATNILRGKAGRWKALRENVSGLRADLDADERVAIVRTAGEYRAARERGQHAALITVQGGNAYEAAPDAAALEDVTRVTVLHLTDSCYGSTSSPARLGAAKGLSAAGKAHVEQLDAARVFVDLAHIHPKGFWDAVDVHDPTLPLIDTHTGVSGVCPHWRNLDDEQIRAVADSGGVVGIIFEPNFLRPKGRASDGRLVIEHLEHLIDVGGEASAALGSDYDGFIRPPADLRDGALAYYRLVQYMLDAGWSEVRIRRVLGENFLASFARLRP